MRLGTRWTVGSPPPAAVPDALRQPLSEAELALGDAAAGATWTLTWLEGRPIATLDDGTSVTLEGTRTVSDEPERSSDDW